MAVLLVLALGPGWGAAAGDPKTPRFASLRAAEVNMRTGPGVRYPIDWVFMRRNLPVEIIADYHNWRKIRGWKGTVGWVHKSMLSGKRTAIVTHGRQPLRDAAADRARVVAHVNAKVVGRLLSCEKDWCRLEVAGIRGWIRRAKLWGVDK